MPLLHHTERRLSIVEATTMVLGLCNRDVIVGILARHGQFYLSHKTRSTRDRMLVSHELRFHNLMLQVQLKHFFMVFLEYRVQHVGKHVLLDKITLLLCRLLLLQRIKLFTAIIFGPLDKVLPNVSLFIECTLMQ